MEKDYKTIGFWIILLFGVLPFCVFQAIRYLELKRKGKKGKED